MRILVRADASHQIGTGHVARCLALANALIEAGHSITFVCARDERGIAERLLEREGRAIDARFLPPFEDEKQDGEDCLSLLAGESFDWVIVDHYGLSAAWERMIRRIARNVAVIEDLASREHDADVLIDQNYYRAEETPHLASNARPALYLIGPRYALLRPGFGRSRDQHDPDAKVLGVFLSGTDPHSDTLKVTRALDGMPEQGWRVEIIAPPAVPQRQEIVDLARQHEKWVVHEHVDDMPGWLRGIGLLVCSGGGFTWEYGCLGVPAVTIGIADNQIRGLEALSAGGYVEYLGESRDVAPERIAMTVASLMEDAEGRAALGRRASTLTDGRGVARIVAALEKMLARFELRPATNADMRAIWEWRNHPEVRRFSNEQQEIRYEDHQGWYRKTLMDDNRHLLIAEHEGEGAGVVRLDQTTLHAVAISIYFAPDYIGKGYGAVLLRDAERWVRHVLPRVTRIEAEILPGNVRSHAVFTKTGYKPEKATHFVRELSREDG